MFGSAKPLASLSSGLLARKGQARPAMRRQGYDHQTLAAPADDLGWNDMGVQDAPPPEAPEIAEVPVPPVLAERADLARQVAGSAAASQPVPGPEPVPEAEPEPAPTVAAETETPPITRRKACRIARESAEQTARGKAAFTLRLDPARHLRLRLASAVAGQSAQQIVAGALDRFLQTMPEVEALAAQLPTRKATA